MEIKKLRLEELRNEEGFQFFTEVKDYTQEQAELCTQLSKYFPDFLKQYADYDTALEQIRKSIYTQKINEADNERDLVFRGLVSTVKGAHGHYEKAKREAATQLQIVFDYYGNIALKGQDEQTATLHNLIRDLQSHHSAELTSLTLNQWVMYLSTLNSNFEELIRARDKESAGKTHLKVKDVRIEIQHTYRQMIELVNSLVKVHGVEQYETYIKQLNVCIDRYKHRLQQRKGSNKSDDKK
ncbi:MAG: DUF6261 family protein [Bacteroidales bacterium]